MHNHIVEPKITAELLRAYNQKDDVLFDLYLNEAKAIIYEHESLLGRLKDVARVAIHGCQPWC